MDVRVLSITLPLASETSSYLEERVMVFGNSEATVSGMP